MRSFLTLLLLFCLTVTVSLAQQSKTTKKPSTARKPSTTAPARRPAAPRPVTTPAATTEEATTAAPTSSQPASLTFPSTEADTEPMDPVKKQQMYDELHGNQAKTVDPKAKGGKTAKETTKKTRKEQPTDTGRSGRASEETASRSRERSAPSGSGEEASSFVGIKAGGNYLTLLDAPAGSEGVWGFHAGVVAQFGNGGFAFQPEVLYNQLSNSGITTSFLQVPLLAKFQFGQQGRTRIFLNVGPYGDYSIDSGSDGAIGFGGALGLGAAIPAGSGRFTIEARGYYPLGSTAEGSEFGPQPGSPLLGQISVGYHFPLGGR
jgi:hypothetical protein